MNELADALLLECTLQQARVAQPHLSRQRVRDTWDAARSAGYVPPRTNSTVFYKSTALGAPRTDPITAAIACGWNDVFLGVSIRPEYENVDHAGQRNYEMGRSMAAAAGSVDALRPWRPDYRYEDLRAMNLISDAQHSALMTEFQYQTREIASAPGDKS